MQIQGLMLGMLLSGCAADDAVFPREDVPSVDDVGKPLDVGTDRGGALDSGVDAARADAGPTDRGGIDGPATDVGAADTGVPDAGLDSGPRDTGALDAGVADMGVADVGVADVGVADVGDASVGFGADAAVEILVSVGGTGGTLFNDDCPAGAAMVGFEGVLGFDGYITQLAVSCAALRLEGDRVRTGAITSLPRRGSNPGSDATLRCPSDQLIVGFEGRAGGLVDQLSFACAPYSSAVVAGVRTFVRGTVTVTTPVGGSGGAAFARISCAGDHAAVGVALRAGDGVDAVTLRCAGLR